MLYRIFTEDKGNNEELCEMITKRGIDGFTIYPTIGYWKGVKEPSICIEIDTQEPSPAFEANIVWIATAIKEANRQECVLVQKIPSTTTFV